MHTTQSINSPYTRSDGHTLHPLDSAVIPALDNDPTLTINGAVFPTISARHGHGGGAQVEVYDPLTNTRTIAALDTMGLDSLIDLLQGIRHDNQAGHQR